MRLRGRGATEEKTEINKRIKEATECDKGHRNYQLDPLFLNFK